MQLAQFIFQDGQTPPNMTMLQPLQRPVKSRSDSNFHP